MQYFKKTDLAKLFKVSVRAVANWVEAAQKGKLDITLLEREGKQYVANTSRNIAVIEKIVEERRKYRTTKAHRVITPKPEFYDLYAPEQILDIIANLEIYREIPRQYNYFNEGASNWDNYSQRLQDEEVTNLLNSTVKLLKVNQDYIDDITQGSNVRIIDVGPGNGLPVKELINHFLQKRKLAGYMGIDISPDLLAILERNFKAWFGGKVNFEGEIKDISYERFNDLLAGGFDRRDHLTNLVLFLGGTLNNFRLRKRVLSTFNESLGKNDLLIYSTKLDSPKSRMYFDFYSQDVVSTLSPNHKFILDLMNFDESLYDVESGFDDVKKMRYIRIVLRSSLSILFRNKLGDHEVKLNSGDRVLVWRAWGSSVTEVLDMFDQTGFELLNSTLTKDGEYLLTIHRVKLDPQ